MNDSVACPSCKRRLRVPADLAGQDVKCPACQALFRPELEPEPLRPAPRRAVDDADRWEEDRPLPSRVRDEDERPSRRRRDEDDEDDRPSRRRRRRADQADHRGVLILVLGLLAVFVAPIPCGPIAWYLGNCDLAEIRAGRMDREGESMTQAGRIIGMITTILTVAVVLLVCLVWAVIIVAFGAAVS